MSILKHQEEFKPRNKSFVTQKFPNCEYLKSYAGLVDKKSLNQFWKTVKSKKKLSKKIKMTLKNKWDDVISSGVKHTTQRSKY